MKSLLLVLMSLVASLNAQAKMGQVLVVLPSVDYVRVKGGGTHPTGFFLSELTVVGMELTRAGYGVTFATPGGKKPTMDKISDSAQWFSSAEEYEAAKRWLASQSSFSRPQALEGLSTQTLARFKGVFVPGGHAAMEGLASNMDMGRVLAYFHSTAKPTALICHGPAALLSSESPNGRWIYDGYVMTVFSNAEEKQEEDAGHLDGYMLYYIEDAFRDRGGIVRVGAPWTSHVVRDRELITGQNPMSDKALAKELINALNE